MCLLDRFVLRQNHYVLCPAPLYEGLGIFLFLPPPMVVQRVIISVEHHTDQCRSNARMLKGDLGHVEIGEGIVLVLFRDLRTLVLKHD